MYAVTRRYRFDPANSEKIAAIINDVFLPALRQAPGLHAYYWLDNDDGVGISVGVFEQREGAEDSVKLAAELIRKHLAGLVSQPEIVHGDVKAYA